MGPVPQDADAFKHVFSLKGSSGQSPCPWCKNCMGRLPSFEDDSGFAHIQSPQHHKFQRHTNDSFFAMVDELELVHGNAEVRKAKETKIRRELRAHRNPMVPRSPPALKIPRSCILGPHALPSGERRRYPTRVEPIHSSHMSEKGTSGACVGRVPPDH